MRLWFARLETFECMVMLDEGGVLGVEVEGEGDEGR